MLMYVDESQYRPIYIIYILQSMLICVDICWYMQISADICSYNVCVCHHGYWYGVWASILYNGNPYQTLLIGDEHIIYPPTFDQSTLKVEMNPIWEYLVISRIIWIQVHIHIYIYIYKHRISYITYVCYVCIYL